MKPGATARPDTSSSCRPRSPIARMTLSYTSALIGDAVLIPLANVFIVGQLLAWRRRPRTAEVAGAFLASALITGFLHLYQAANALLNWTMMQPYRWTGIGYEHAAFMWAEIGLVLFFWDQVGLDEDRGVHVAVSEVPVEDDCDPELGPHLARPAHGLRDLRKRHREILAREDAVLPRMRERCRGGEPAAAGPETCDLLLVLGEARDRRVLADDAVGVAHVRGDLLRRALDLDEEDSLALR